MFGFKTKLDLDNKTPQLVFGLSAALDRAR